MADFQYIHIALRGELQGATRTLYSYPSDSTADPQWDTTMVEPGAAIKRFLNATDCYVMQADSKGHYFSLITRDSLHPERGYLMISILVDNGCSLTGRQLMTTFNNLKRAFIDDNLLTDDAVDSALHQASVPVEPVRLESWTYHIPDPDTELAEAAYRTYISVQELESIFSFPAQPEYAPYRCVIVVSAASSLRPGIKMPRITTQVRKLYTVVCPEGATASASQIYDGDRLTITYSKEGFNSHTETVVAGTPSAYVKNDGSTLQVRTAAQTGIRFIRKVGLKVLSAKGTDINGFTVSVNGRAINTMVPYIEFTERDLTPGEQIEIQVASNNYHPLKLKKPTEEILTTDHLDLTLSPVEQGITLRLDFGDDRVFEEHISIEKNTPEYNRLHSGNFHGFRAHRLVTQDGSEVYNVDVRITSRPVAPNFETSPVHDPDTAATPATPHRAPVFEKATPDPSVSTPRPDMTAPSAATPTGVDTDTDSDDPADTILAPAPWYRRTWLWIATAILLAAIGGALVYINNTPAGPADTAATGTPADSIAQTDAATPAPTPATPEEQTDIDYLNSNPVWDTASLHSPMGTELIDAINAGDIDRLVNNSYFAVAGRCTNEKAIQIADLVWRAKGSYSESSNKRLLRSAVKGGSINLRTLADDLAKRRPAEKENLTPRPSRP
ncbi:MAG: hypothetical protein HFJ95_01955 [Muribaculaceae bacterium]|nr:hypothetical protein [Muribaculaceae bacterium]